MKFLTYVLIAAFAAVTLSLDVTLLAGTKPEGKTCTAPMECLEPLYCLKVSDKEHQCGKKPCKGQGQCRIGQFCGDDGLCAAPNCKNDGECSGATVCQTTGKCGSKSSGGQACSRGSQCWSGKCAEGKCTGSDGTVSDSDPVAPITEDKEHDDHEGHDQEEGEHEEHEDHEGQEFQTGHGDEDHDDHKGHDHEEGEEHDHEEGEHDADEQGIVSDAVDTVGDVAGGAADVVDDTVSKAFSLGGGGIAGIIIGVLVLLGICCGILFCCRKVRNRGDN